MPADTVAVISMVPTKSKCEEGGEEEEEVEEEEEDDEVSCSLRSLLPTEGDAETEQRQVVLSAVNPTTLQPFAFEFTFATGP